MEDYTFFYQYLILINQSKEKVNAILGLSSASYFTLRSVFLEMPDITLFFYFYFFLYQAENMLRQKFRSCFWIGLLCFAAVMTKPTGLLFFFSCILSFFMYLVFQRKFSKSLIFSVLATGVGTFLGKFLNSSIINNLKNSGYEVNSYWIHVSSSYGHYFLKL